MSEHSNGPHENGSPADGSDLPASSTATVKTTYQDGKVVCVEISDPDSPDTKWGAVFYGGCAPCEHQVRKSAEFWSKWSKVLPAKTDAPIPGAPIPEPSADGPELPTIPPSENGTAATKAGRNGRTSEAIVELLDLVTLDQAAGAAHTSKRTLERHKTEGTLPDPVREGGGGKSALYDWKVMRPWLTENFGIVLPDKFPANMR